MRSAARAIATSLVRGGDGSAAATRRAGPAKAAVENASEFGFNGGEAGIKQIATRYDNDVVAGRKLVVTEHLSNESLCSVSRDRATDLTGGSNSKPSDLQFIV